MSSEVEGQVGLGFGALFGASIGVIVSQLGMLTLMQGVGLGGWSFLLAMVLAFVLALANAMAYAEMALMMPSAGSLSTYVEAALGNFPAILMVFAGYVTPAMFGLPVELMMANHVLTSTIPLHVPPDFWIGVLLLGFVGLNMMGADVFAKIQTVLSVTVLLFLVITGGVAMLGLSAAPAAHATLIDIGGPGVVASLAALAFWLFVGTEFVTPLVPMARNARRDLPRAMIGGLVIILLAELAFAAGAGRVVLSNVLTTAAVPHMVYALAVYGPKAKVAFAVLAVLASASLLNSVLGAVPRMLQGMAENGQVFPILGKVSKRSGTPLVSIVFVALLPLVGLIWSGGDPDSIVPLTIAASVAWILAYILAQVSLLVLRKRYPDASRPFRAPGLPWLPGLAIVGMVGVIATSSPAPALTASIARYTGIVLLLFAIIGFFWVRFVMRRGLFEAVPNADLRSQELDAPNEARIASAGAQG